MKKTITLLTGMIFAALSGFAQYYYIPSLNPGMNPGGLNNDIEQPGATGWTVIKTGGNASPAWSSNAVVPFTFNFNGAPVTTFKVSTSGVLTFDVAAVTPPATNNAALPDASVPDNSICVWGIEGSGANDEIRTKTFGAQPNRQHWIQFNSYTAPGGSYTYWAIVLEETSNSIYIVDQRTTAGGPVTLSAGIQINNALAYSVAGSPNLGALTPQELDTPLDNVYYEFAYGVQNTYDTKGQSITVAPYLSLVNAPFSITGTLQNRGSVAITSMDLNYSINGGATVTANVVANVASGAMYSFTHPTTWNPGAAGAYTIMCWASNINNGNADQYPSDDDVSKTVNVATTLAQRMVLFEQFTSSTCGPCAGANPTFNALLDNNASKSCAIKYQMNYPGAGDDPCYTTESGTRHTYYNVGGIPHVNMTGLKFDGHPANMTQGILDNDYNSNPGLFDIDVSFKIVGSTLTAYVTSTAQVAIASNNLKLHVAVVEDHVSHSAQSNGETDFYDVMRKMLPNASGTTMAAQTSGQVVNTTLNYTIPAGGGAPIVNGELRVVAFIQDNLTKEVFQAAYAAAPSNIKELTTGKNFIAVYPNPFTNSAEVSFTLEQSEFVKMEVYNVTGDVVASSNQGKLNAGRNYIQLDGSNLSSGIYFVSITAGENTYKQKVTISK